MLNFIKQQVFPGVYASYVNRKISVIYEKQKKLNIDVSAIKKNKEKYISELENELKNQYERKTKTEDKAKSLLFIISLSITAITFSLNYIKGTSNQMISIIFISLSIMYFVFAGIRALQTLNIKEFHILQPDITVKDISIILNKKKKNNLILKELVLQKSLNDLINIKISNLTYASFIMIRNGITLFMFFFITNIASNFFSNDSELIVKENQK